MANNLISAWGSVGAGKTSTCVKIAKVLAEKKNNVILVLCDDVTPSLPLLLPCATNTKSLGDLLSLSALNQINIYQHCVAAGGYLSLLGYQLGETERTYPEYDLKRARKLLTLLRCSADYVIVDCSNHLISNVLTAAALEAADTVLKVVNPDLKSNIYIQSQITLLKESRFRLDKQINVMNNILPDQDTTSFSEFLGGVSYFLPHLPALNEQYDSGKLMEDLVGRDAKKYEPVIKTMVSEVILYE
jgi:cellulose biosynthesis protein BcsQ